MEHYPDKRTATAWANNCLEMLPEINPDYYRNKHSKGRFIEFLRIDDFGLLVSQNFTKIREVYHLFFSLLFSDKRGPGSLYHRLMAGSRFGHNRTVASLFKQGTRLVVERSGLP